MGISYILFEYCNLEILEIKNLLKYICRIIFSDNRLLFLFSNRQ